MKEVPTETAAPPPIIPRRVWPLPLVLALGSLLALAGVLLFVFDPAHHAFYPVCLFKKMTGYDCPGCGGLRSVHELLRGDLWRAFQLNAMVVVALPLLAVWTVLRWRNSSREGHRPRSRSTLLWAWLLVATVVTFGVLRNLPFWPFGVTPI